MQLFQHYRSVISKKGFLLSTLLGLLFLAVSVTLNYMAGTYAYSVMSNGVSDLILDVLPVFDVHLVFVDGAVLMVLVALVMNILRPQFIPFTSKAVGLLYLFRSVALTLTHLGPPLGVTNLYLADSITERFIFGADYFFSGHTALPFVFALIFWQNKIARYFFLACMIIFGATSLMGHVHYSIDVFAAPFIAYTVFAMCEKLFKKDRELIRDL